MKKTKELPFQGVYGFQHEHSFRYFHLGEKSEDLNNYKEDILKCLKYDVLYAIFPDYKSGNKVYDSLRPPISLPVQISYNTFGYVFPESVQGKSNGELVVVFKVSEGNKKLELTLYDRNTVLEVMNFRNESTNEDNLEYALVDRIVESKIEFIKGKKISKKDIKVYDSETKLLDSPEHNYEESLKVINAVKAKCKTKQFDPTDVLVNVNENTQDKKNKKSK